jgi:hypothetical protein
VATAAAHALALIHGQPVLITALQVDTAAGLVTALQFKTADGGEQTLTVNREPPQPEIVRPHERSRWIKWG